MRTNVRHSPRFDFLPCASASFTPAPRNSTSRASAHGWPLAFTPSARFPAVGKLGPLRCEC